MFTKSLILILGLALFMPALAAETPEPAPAGEQVIEPELDRRKIIVPKIDTEDFEVNVYAGLVSFEDFGTKPVYGARIAFHVTEDFFLEAAFGLSEISDTSFRDLGLALFPNEDEDVTYYNLSLGFNPFPGEIFIGGNRAMSSTLYLIGGVGNIEFIDEDEFEYHFGFGMRVMPKDWLTIRLELRDYIFETDLLGENKFTNNLETTLSVGIFF